MAVETKNDKNIYCIERHFIPLFLKKKEFLLKTQLRWICDQFTFSIQSIIRM